MFQVFNNFCGNKKVPQSEVEPNTRNDFFVSIGKHLSESIPLAGSASRHFEKNPSRFLVFKTDGHEVNKIITALKPKSSCGHDGLSKKWLNCVHLSSMFS